MGILEEQLTCSMIDSISFLRGGIGGFTRERLANFEWPDQIEVGDLFHLRSRTIRIRNSAIEGVVLGFQIQ